MNTETFCVDQMARLTVANIAHTPTRSFFVLTMGKGFVFILGTKLENGKVEAFEVSRGFQEPPGWGYATRCEYELERLLRRTIVPYKQVPDWAKQPFVEWVEETYGDLHLVEDWPPTTELN